MAKNYYNSRDIKFFQGFTFLARPVCSNQRGQSIGPPSQGRKPRATEIVFDKLWSAL